MQPLVNNLFRMKENVAMVDGWVAPALNQAGCAGLTGLYQAGLKRIDS
jgi:hypothetical protein